MRDKLYYIIFFSFIIWSTLPAGICHSRGLWAWGRKNFPLLFGVHYRAESSTPRGRCHGNNFV